MKSKREARNAKDMYQTMLGQAQKIEEKNRRPGKMSRNEDVPKHKLRGYLIESILVVVAGVAIDGKCPVPELDSGLLLLFGVFLIKNFLQLKNFYATFGLHTKEFFTYREDMMRE